MRNPNIASLADFVRATRKAKGFNQQQVRDRGGPATGTLGAIEAGTIDAVPKRATLEKLATGLGVPLDDVLKAAGEYVASPDWAQTSHDPLPSEAFTGRYPVTDEEQRIYDAAVKERVNTYSVKIPGFWDLEPDLRRETFRNLEGLTEATARIRKLLGAKDGTQN